MAGTQLTGTWLAPAQTPDGAATAGQAGADNPGAQVRQKRSWEYGPFVNYGNGVGERSSFKFLSAGLQGGKALTPVLGGGIFRGQFEFGANVMPFWQAYTPAAGEQTFSYPIRSEEHTSELQSPCT